MVVSTQFRYSVSKFSRYCLDIL